MDRVTEGVDPNDPLVKSWLKLKFIALIKMDHIQNTWLENTTRLASHIQLRSYKTVSFRREWIIKIDGTTITKPICPSLDIENTRLCEVCDWQSWNLDKSKFMEKMTEKSCG